MLDRRTGIPITLSTVYIEVGRRAGRRVARRGPARALRGAASRTAGGEALVDPFHGGTVLTPQDCQDAARPHLRRPRALDADMLARLRRARRARPHAAEPEGHLPQGRRPRARAARASSCSSASIPTRVEDLRDRGLVLRRPRLLRAWPRADLEAYLSPSAHAPGDDAAAGRGSRSCATRRRASTEREGASMSTTKIGGDAAASRRSKTLLGERRARAARAPLPGHPAETLHLPGPDFVDRVHAGVRPARARAAQPAAAPRPRPPGRHRLPLDPARRPGHRALGGRLLREEPGSTSTPRTS